MAKDDAAKVKKRRRIAFQTPESENHPCDRTFEDSFILANPEMFDIEGATCEEQINCASNKLGNIKKSEFALKYAIDISDWIAPGARLSA